MCKLLGHSDLCANRQLFLPESDSKLLNFNAEEDTSKGTFPGICRISEVFSPLRPLSLAVRNWRRGGRDFYLSASTLIQLPFITAAFSLLSNSAAVCINLPCVHRWKAKGKFKAPNMPQFKFFLIHILVYIFICPHLCFKSCSIICPFRRELLLENEGLCQRLNRQKWSKV